MLENGAGESHQHHEALDADAVCAQCSTINPEGTLICRKCGNNLRDQRAVRLQANEQLVIAPPMQKRRIATALLTLMGFLLIFWTLLNLERITDGLINMNSPKAKMIRSFWEGEDKDLYEELYDELSKNLPDSDAIDLALDQPAPLGQDGGIFVILDLNGKYNRRDPICANVYIEDDFVYFVAMSRQHEIRGKAEIRGDNVVVKMNDAAVDARGRRSLVMGIAAQIEDGVFECSGSIEDVNNQYEFYAVLVQ